jgi:hypothetical protein
MAQKFNFENQPNHSAPELLTKKSKADRTVEAERDLMLKLAKERGNNNAGIFENGVDVLNPERKLGAKSAENKLKKFAGEKVQGLWKGLKKIGDKAKNVVERAQFEHGQNQNIKELRRQGEEIPDNLETWEEFQAKKSVEKTKKPEENQPEENGENFESQTNTEAELDSSMAEVREEITGGMTPVERKNLFKQMKGWSKDQVEKYKSLPAKDKIIVAGIAVGAIGLVGAGGFAAVTAAGLSGSGIGSFTALGMGESVLGFGAIEGVKGVAVGTAAFMAKVYAGGMAAGAITGSGLSAYGGIKVLDKLSKKAKENNINPEDLETVTTTATIENNSQATNQTSQNETIPDISTVEPEPVSQRKGFGKTIDRAKNNFQQTQPKRQNMPLQTVQGMVKVEKVQQDVVEPQNQSQENIKTEESIEDIISEVNEIVEGSTPTTSLEEFVNKVCRLKAESELSRFQFISANEKSIKSREIFEKYKNVKNQILNNPNFPQKANIHNEKLKAQKEAGLQTNVEPAVQSKENTEHSKDVMKLVKEITDEMYAIDPTIPLELFVERKCEMKKQKEVNSLPNYLFEIMNVKCKEISEKYLEVKNTILRDPEFQKRAREHDAKSNQQIEIDSQTKIEPSEPAQEITQPEVELSTDVGSPLDRLKTAVPVVETTSQHVNAQEQRATRDADLRNQLKVLSGEPASEKEINGTQTLETLRQNSESKVEPKYERINVEDEANKLIDKFLENHPDGLRLLDSDKIADICIKRDLDYSYNDGIRDKEALAQIHDDYYEVSRWMNGLVAQRLRQESQSTETTPNAKNSESTLENLKNASKVENYSERFPIPPTPQELALQRQQEELKSEPEVVVQERSDPYKAPDFFDNEPSQQVEAVQIAESSDSLELASLGAELTRLNAELSATDENWENRGRLEAVDQVDLGRTRKNLETSIFRIEKKVRIEEERQRKEGLIEESIPGSGENINTLALVQELEKMEEESKSVTAGSPEEKLLYLKIKELMNKIYENGFESAMSTREIRKLRSSIFIKLRSSIINGDYENLTKFVKNPLKVNEESNRKFAINEFNSEINLAKQTIIENDGYIEIVNKFNYNGKTRSDLEEDFLRYQTNKADSEKKIANFTKALEIINSL